MIELVNLYARLPPATLALLQESFHVHTLPPDPEARDRALQALSGSVRGIVTGTGGKVDDAMMARFPKLELIVCYSAGMDPVDLKAADRRNIPVLNNSRALGDSVADLALGFLLCIARNICGADAHVRQNLWKARRYIPGNLLRGRKLGIVGLGTIGGGIATRAAGFGLEIGYRNPRQKPDVPYKFFDSIGALAEWCDIMVLSCPGGPDTRHLINASVLSAIGPEGWLINVARSSVVDQDALIAALNDGRLGRAAIDVFEQEPNVPEALIASDRVLLSPHQGSSTVEIVPVRGKVLLEQLRDHFGV